MQTTVQTAQTTPAPLECPECAARLTTCPTMAGEILDCPDCGAQLEVRSLAPLTLALAPDVEEDWGE
jgi:alpha-aminoadipate carrier protein LysW